MRARRFFPLLAIGIGLLFASPLSAQVSPIPTPIPGSAYAYVTSATMMGNFGGLLSADAMCGREAPESLRRLSWQAILSDNRTDVNTRFRHFDGPVRDVLGGVLVSRLSRIFDTGFDSPLVLNQLGQSTSGAVWTGSWVGGVRDPFTRNCENWATWFQNGRLGLVGGAGQDWLKGAVNTHPVQCTTYARIYCLGSPNQVPPTATPTPTPVRAPLRFFVSSQAITGDMGGLAGADAFCTRLAASTPLRGTYRAVLSTSAIAARDRFTIEGPVINSNGMNISLSVANMFALRGGTDRWFDENGARVTANRAWTDSHLLGEQTGFGSEGACRGWTTTTGESSYGDPTSTTGNWLRAGTNGLVFSPCSAPLRVYCLEQPGAVLAPSPTPTVTTTPTHTVTATPTPRDGTFAYIFVTSSTHSGDLDGRAGADALCQRMAPEGLRSLHWLSMLPDSGAAARHRFNHFDGPVYDLRRRLVHGSLRSFLIPGWLMNPISVTETGRDLLEDFPNQPRYMWSLGQEFTAPGSNYCNFWRNSQPSQTAPLGRIGSTGPDALAFDWANPARPEFQCSNQHHVPCIGTWQQPRPTATVTATPTVTQTPTITQTPTQTATPTTPPLGSVGYLFITRDKFSGDLGGLAGADEKCAALAPESKPGLTWKALLGDLQNDGVMRRFEGRTFRDIRLLDLSERYISMLSQIGELYNPFPVPLELDERGQRVSGGYIWGRRFINTSPSSPPWTACDNWTSSRSWSRGNIWAAGQRALPALSAPSHLDYCPQFHSLLCLGLHEVAPTATPTATPSPTFTPVPPATRTPTATPTLTATSSPTPTATATLTPTSSTQSTATPTQTATSSPTATHTATATMTPTLPSGSGFHRLFTTSLAYAGSFGGVQRADALCRLAALRAGVAQATNFKAILSDSKESARDRLNIAGPVRLFDGTLIAQSAADLFDGTLLRAPRINERGEMVPDSRTNWTASDTGGRFVPQRHQTCDDWTAPLESQRFGTVGRTHDTNANWLEVSEGGIPVAQPCAIRAGLYCIDSEPLSGGNGSSGIRTRGLQVEKSPDVEAFNIQSKVKVDGRGNTFLTWDPRLVPPGTQYLSALITSDEQSINVVFSPKVSQLRVPDIAGARSFLQMRFHLAGNRVLPISTRIFNNPPHRRNREPASHPLPLYSIKREIVGIFDLQTLNFVPKPAAIDTAQLPQPIIGAPLKLKNDGTQVEMVSLNSRSSGATVTMPLPLQADLAEISGSKLLLYSRHQQAIFSYNLKTGRLRRRVTLRSIAPAIGDIKSMTENDGTLFFTTSAGYVGIREKRTPTQAYFILPGELYLH
jgi:hypothetical protein